MRGVLFHDSMEKTILQPKKKSWDIVGSVTNYPKREAVDVPMYIQK